MCHMRGVDCARTQAAIYRIRVAGVLGEEWSGRAQGMAISVHRSECAMSFTELFGVLPDDAALMGFSMRSTRTAPGCCASSRSEKNEP